MKKFLKENFIAIFIFFILSIIVVHACLTANSNFNNLRQRIEKNKSECVEVLNDKSNYTEDHVNYCKEMENSLGANDIDIYTYLQEVLFFGLYWFNPVAFLIAVIPMLYTLSKKFRYKYIINVNNRESYKNFKKEIFKDGYKYFWIIPALLLIIFINGIIFYKLDYHYTVEYMTSAWYDSSLIYNPIVFLALFFIYILLLNFTYINMGLIVVRKVHKFFPAVLVSYIFCISVQLFLELILKNLCLILFKSEIGYAFNIMSPLSFNINFGEAPIMLFALFAFIISSTVVAMCYKNKEKLIVACEKNE